MATQISNEVPYGTTIFCDDIREEVGGKHTFVGCYPGFLVVPRFPVALPKLCLAITYLEPIHFTHEKITVRVYAPADDKAIYHTEFLTDVGRMPEFPLKQDEQPVIRGMTVFVVFPNLEVASPGLLKVRAERVGKITRLGALVFSALK
ncbi:MAG: DUF6941 family protein [Micropepsaceae bacterium]